MMKLVLIRPPRPISDAAFISLQFPLNLAYIATFLQQKGYAVEIWDYEVERFSEDGLCKRISKSKPNLIGITCLTPTIIAAHKIASIIKKASSNILIVVGGPHPTAMPAETLHEFNNFDIIVIGEGEETLWEILRYIEEKRPIIGIRGIAYRQEGKEIKIENPRPFFEDLNVLPFPDRNIVKQNLYRKHHVSRAFSRQFLNISEMMISRGCPSSCIFCACHNRPTRFRKIENVITEMSECINRYKTSHFSFLDDTLTLDSGYIIELCNRFKKFKKISWDCFARVDTVSFKILKGMAASGCRKISYGVESGSPRILTLINKNISLKQIKNAFIWSRQAGIEYIEGSFMIGSHPTENKQDIDLTIKLIYEIEPDILMLSLMAPYPGTQIYAIMKEKGYLQNETGWENFTFLSYRPAWETDNFSSSELLSIHRNLLCKFYLRPKYIFKIICKIRSWNESLYWLKEGLGFLRKMNKII